MNKNYALRPLIGLLIVLATSCHPVSRTVSPPVAAAPAVPDVIGQLSQQNVDGVIYQNSSAEVHRLYQQGYELARIRLDANLERPHTLPPAVIVDIDETVLDNSPSNAEDAANGRTFSPAEWKKWTALAKAKALPGAVDFLNYAVSRGCAIFYISNREMDEKDATVRNLASEGFPMADAAHVMPMGDTSDKTERRAEVAKKHYIALLVGDQLTDFDQSLKDRSDQFGKARVDAMRDTLDRYFIMLPNAMYGAWLNAVSGSPDSVKLGNKERFLNEHGY
ncbi:MAG: 5'-nucleotidase, lipoprotein e(P4) family [Flavobacteriales bacterium]|jgi:5'-nucleotidase (lipoprotein e(P4) family)|nr:5'-nucleotidase, lipoprotein e(P4) family [Flavobacteriales bacterium]MCB0759414.1 5'-nucleotidase, lipoprotein e(P4) family [Flavobacteriales bacterium]